MALSGPNSAVHLVARIIPSPRIELIETSAPVRACIEGTRRFKLPSRAKLRAALRNVQAHFSLWFKQPNSLDFAPRACMCYASNQTHPLYKSILKYNLICCLEYPKVCFYSV